MSKELFNINRLSGDQFFSSQGVAIQLTKMKTMSSDESNFKGFIHLTPEDALMLAAQLTKWAKPIVRERKRSKNWQGTKDLV